MIPKESHSQLKRYRFNSKPQNNDHNNQQAVICLWISGLIIICFLILGGIKLVNPARPSIQHSHVSRHVSKSNTPQSLTGNNNRTVNGSRSHSINASRPDDEPPAKPRSIDHKQRFSSVSNAKDWAQVTQHRWLHQGYTNYMVRSDGQGDYYLQFTK